MAYKTWLNVVNDVQRRMRDTVTASVTSTPYSTLLGIFVNDVKREVEDAWNWNTLRDTVVATTAAGTRAYVLTNAGQRCRVLDVYNDTENYPLFPIKGTSQTISMLDPANQDKPQYYTFNGEYQGDPITDMYPIPDGVYAINFNLVIPQPDLDADSDEIYVPWHVVSLGAYVKALVERGEYNGDDLNIAVQRYREALNAAISQDEARLPFETDFYAV